MNNMNSHQEPSSQWLGLITSAVLIFVFLSAFAGAVWMSRNISNIPEYGDTGEYLVLSKHLLVDQYRGILYPYLLNLSNYWAYVIGINIQHVVYCIQILLTFFSSYLLAYAISPYLRKDGPSVPCQLPAFFAGAVVLLDPLVAHFSLTILADSLATSFTMMFLSFLIFALKDNKRQFLYIALSTLFLVFISLIRIDKLYFGLIVFFFFIVLLALKNKSQGNRRKKTAIAFSIFSLCVAMLCVSFVKSETQIYNHNRPPLDISSLAFNRIVWPRMSDAYKYFPVKIKEKITEAEAQEFDKHSNNVFPFLVKTLQENDGKKIISSITRITLEHFPIQVAAKTAFDFAKYTVPNLMFPLEALGILPTSVATSWTITRMEMFQPTLT
jgi:4-amino-4-deoxy-L-arabinose transferase-like glycosyltransferase